MLVKKRILARTAGPGHTVPLLWLFLAVVGVASFVLRRTVFGRVCLRGGLEPESALGRRPRVRQRRGELVRRQGWHHRSLILVAVAFDQWQGRRARGA